VTTGKPVTELVVVEVDFHALRSRDPVDDILFGGRDSRFDLRKDRWRRCHSAKWRGYGKQSPEFDGQISRSYREPIATVTCGGGVLAFPCAAAKYVRSPRRARLFAESLAWGP
jgi:hypothetical protein